MAGDYLLDTSVVVEFLRGTQTVRARVEAAPGVCTSATVLGELLYGAERSAQRDRGMRHIEDFLRDCPVAVCDQKTAGFYSRIRAALAAKGHPLPENDIWIAASAIQHDLVLAARDDHFRWIDGLVLEQW